MHRTPCIDPVNSLLALFTMNANGRRCVVCYERDERALTVTDRQTDRKVLRGCVSLASS